MGTDKRERQKANKRAKQAEVEAAEARARRIRFIRNVVVLAVGIVIVAFLMNVLSGCSSSNDDERSSSSDTDVTTTTGKGKGDTVACPPADGVDKPVIDFAGPPPTCIDPGKTYTATFETSKGDVTVELDTDRTPGTTNAFVFLARNGFYDGTDLFRTEAASGIIQGGSPHTQNNTDPGAGFAITDEALPFSSDDYGPGTIAMARTSAPDSASGQFFFLANDGGRYLGDPKQLGESAGSYVAFGRVTKGLEVLQTIAALDDGSGAPLEQVTIKRVTISES